MTQVFRLFVAACLIAPLAGCYGVIGPKEIPEWALNSQPDVVEARPAARRVVRIRQDEPLSSAAVAARADARRADTSDTTQPSASTYGPEWQARQDAADERLRRRMNICNGC